MPLISCPIPLVSSSRGLLRYDGVEYKKYKYDPENDKSLNYNVVSSLFEDTKGNLCIGTQVGLNIFNRETEKFIHYSDDSIHTNNGGTSLYDFYNHNSNPIWINSDGRGLFKPVLGNILVEPSDIKKLLNKDITDSIAMMNDNPVYYTAILETKGGNVWIGTQGGGLIKFNKKTGQFTHYLHNPEDPTSLSDNRVFTIYEDRLGEIWIGTYGGGLNRLVSTENGKDNPSFIHFKHETENPRSLNDNRVFSIYEDSFGNLWIGTHSGLNKLNRDDNQFQRFDMQSVWSIYQDDSGVLWLGTDNGGLYKLNRNKLNFKHYKHEPENPNSLNGNIIFWI